MRLPHPTRARTRTFSLAPSAASSRDRGSETVEVAGVLALTSAWRPVQQILGPGALLPRAKSIIRPRALGDVDQSGLQVPGYRSLDSEQATRDKGMRSGHESVLLPRHEASCHQYSAEGCKMIPFWSGDPVGRTPVQARMVDIVREQATSANEDVRQTVSDSDSKTAIRAKERRGTDLCVC